MNAAGVETGLDRGGSFSPRTAKQVYFRGNHPATVDAKGRLKIPTRFRELLLKTWGPEVFVTCPFTESDHVRIYPINVWEKIEKKLMSLPPFDPSRDPVADAASVNGLEAKVDAQGRVLISQRLRQLAGAEGAEVYVLGKGEHIEVWNREHFDARLQARPTTPENLARLSAHAVWSPGTTPIPAPEAAPELEQKGKTTKAKKSRS